MRKKYCKAITKKGKKCHHFAKYPKENPKYCTVHWCEIMEEK